MKIEILTRRVEKKADILTLLAAFPGCYRGHVYTTEGLALEIGADYLYFNLTSPRWAEQIIRTLFTVVPSRFVPGFYELESDQKVIATVKARSPAEVVAVLDRIEHLDLERNELLGEKMIEFRQRDVAVQAFLRVGIEGGIGWAKIKFAGQQRDVELNCRRLLQKITLRRLLGFLTTEELSQPPQPLIQPLTLKGQVTVTADRWAQLLYEPFGCLNYDPETETYCWEMLTSGNRLIAAARDDRTVDLEMTLLQPEVIPYAFWQVWDQITKESKLVGEAIVQNILLSPDAALKKIGLKKESNFYLFKGEMILDTGLPGEAGYESRVSRWEVWYDIKEMVYSVRAVFLPEEMAAAAAAWPFWRQKIDDYLNGVVHYALAKPVN